MGDIITIINAVQQLVTEVLRLGWPFQWIAELFCNCPGTHISPLTYDGKYFGNHLRRNRLHVLSVADNARKLSEVLVEVGRLL